MRTALPCRTTPLLLALILILSGSCFAQAPLEPAQLPAQASFYLIWRGTPTGDVRHSNALLSFWDDPDSAPLRSGIVDLLMSDAKKQKDKPVLSREELAEYATLLDNPLVLGYFSQPDQPPAPKTTAPGTPTWNGLFLVYDRTGKEALLSKAVLRLRGSESDIPKLTDIT